MKDGLMHSSLLRRRCLWALAALLVAVMAIAVFNRRAIHRLVFTKDLYSIYHGALRLERVSRWSEELDVSYTSREWFLSNGYLKRTLSFEEPNVSYNSDGTVRMQEGGSGTETRYEPPWQVPDQTAPSAPWILVGQTFEEWWTTIPESNKES